ncbi:MAG: hypothetical protein HQL91_02890 [Magnetococcales bacterium]|nr:hypothetical protein [Magnetococcales bacterium]
MRKLGAQGAPDDSTTRNKDPTMVDLPGRRAQLEKQAQQANAAAENKKTAAVPEVAPPTPGQVESLHDQLRHEEDIVLAGRLEEVRKKREQELQRGKPKTTEKVDIATLKFAREEKKSGLPERIRKLPKDHPVRVMYEKGYKQKGISVRRDSHVYVEDSLSFGDMLRQIGKPLGYLLLVGAIIAGFYYGSQRYESGAVETRNEILITIKAKNYRPDHPLLAKEFNTLYWSNWLPDLQRLLSHVRNLGVNYDAYDSNPEPGSYLEYIKRYNRPFNQAEAMEWYAKEIRKPSR